MLIMQVYDLMLSYFRKNRSLAVSSEVHKQTAYVRWTQTLTSLNNFLKLTLQALPSTYIFLLSFLVNLCHSVIIHEVVLIQMYRHKPSISNPKKNLSPENFSGKPSEFVEYNKRKPSHL